MGSKLLMTDRDPLERSLNYLFAPLPKRGLALYELDYYPILRIPVFSTAAQIQSTCERLVKVLNPVVVPVRLVCAWDSCPNQGSNPIYQYSRDQTAIAQGKSIDLAERDPKDDALWQFGIPATCWIGGKGNFVKSPFPTLHVLHGQVLQPVQDCP